MGTRRRDAERRQVSLAVEALEDRFLLSGAASPFIPAPTNEQAMLYAAHISAAKNETPSLSSHAALGQASVSQNSAPAAKTALSANSAPSMPNALLKPMVDHPLDRDIDDDDPPGMTDRDASRNAPLGFLLSAYDCSDAMSGFDCPLLARSLEQATLPAMNAMSFLPLLSATGLGAARMTPLPLATTISQNASGNYDPAPGKEEIRPMPAVPQAPTPSVPPLVEEAAEQSWSAGGPFAELLPIDVEAIQHGLDGFFQQLGDLSEEWRGGQVLEKLAPWLMAASLAGYGWIRIRDHRDRRLADLLGTDRLEAAPSLFLPRGEG